MIIAWVLYYTGDEYKFHELTGSDFASTVPGDWGLPNNHSIHLVLHKSQHLGAWVEGKPVKP